MTALAQWGSCMNEETKLSKTNGSLISESKEQTLWWGGDSAPEIKRRAGGSSAEQWLDLSSLKVERRGQLQRTTVFKEGNWVYRSDYR